MTVRDLLTRMSSREIAEWRAYFQIENFEQQQRAAMAKPGASKFNLPTE